MAKMDCGLKIKTEPQDETSAVVTIISSQDIKQEPSNDYSNTSTAEVNATVQEYGDRENSHLNIEAIGNNERPNLNGCHDDSSNLLTDNASKDVLRNDDVRIDEKSCSSDNVWNHRNEQFTCEICEAVFCYEVDYRTHEQMHAIKTNSENGTTSAVKTGMYNDIKYTVHVFDGQKLYQCSSCEIYFKDLSNLATHIRTHSKEKRYRCEECEKSFLYQSQLARHSRSHSGEKPYKCDVCDKSFTQQGYLKVHARKHTGVRPHKCEVCENSFYTQAELKKHIRTHTGEKPFKCDACEKSFASRWKLASHVRTHSGEKPYTCGVCEKSFVQQGYLSIHLRTHTGEKPYACSVCERSFAQQSHLSNHLRRCHPEKHAPKQNRGHEVVSTVNKKVTVIKFANEDDRNTVLRYAREGRLKEIVFGTDGLKTSGEDPSNVACKNLQAETSKQ